MTFEDFKTELMKGGATAAGRTYALSDEGKLMINVPDTATGEYVISAKMVEDYFNKLDGGMDTKEFNYHHSAWFRRVYDTIIK